MRIRGLHRAGTIVSMSQSNSAGPNAKSPRARGFAKAMAKVIVPP
jgi:hypothetical protein